MKPVEIEFLIKNGTKATLEKITTDLNQVGREGSESVGATTAAFENAQHQALFLCKVMEQLEGKIKELQSTPTTIDQTENIAQIDALQKKVEELKAHIKQLEETSENTQVVPPSMPMAKRQFDGLHFSIQQIAREMPTLAMGPQMFFLAISNNLPIFTDELARARKEYDALVASGQKGVPVWKQVVKSIFSWQTAMVTGIMLLVMYGKEITQSISDMIGWKSAKQLMREEIAKSIEIEKEANSVAAKTRFELNQTMSAIRNFTGTKDEERQKVDDLNKKYGETFGYYQTLDDWYKRLTGSAEGYVQMLFLQAKQQSLLNKAMEANQKVEEIEQTMPEDVDGSMGWFKRAIMYNAEAHGKGQKDAVTVIKEYNRSNKDKAIQEAKDEREAYYKEIDELSKQEQELLDKLNVNKKPVGSVADIENSIAMKRKALGGIVDKKDYKKQLAEIEELEARLRSITGAKDPKADKAAQAQKAYDADRLQSIKDAKLAELDLERSAIEDKIKLIEFERDTRIKAIQDEKEVYKQKHGKNADVSGFDREITAVGQQADIDIQEQIKEDAKAQLVAMQEYLKEYGTFQQKKYAVAEEYARKIKEAQTEGERLSLQKELDTYNSNLQAQDLKMNIDWGTVFGEFGGMFSEMIRPALEDAKKYMSTDQFKNSDEASKQALIEAVAQMEKSLGGSGSLNFKQLGLDVQFYQNTLIALNDAKRVEIEAIGKLNEAQEKYNEALKNGTQAEIDAAKTNFENAQDNATTASENVQTQISVSNQAQQTVTNTATTLKASMQTVTDSISKFASGSLAGAFEGITDLLSKFGSSDVVGKLSENISIPIIKDILSILDILQDGLSNLVGGLLDAIFNAINGIISDILSLDLLKTVGESISKGVVNIVKSIVTLGGALSFMDAESDPKLQEDIDRLTASNERLEKALNRLADKMGDAATSEATSVYKEQLDNVTNREKNTQEMMQREAAAWARSGYGFAGLKGRGSSNSKIDDNISGAEWATISEVVGRNIGSAGDFWGLSSEEMAKVADEVGWIYDKIKGYADDGHKDAAKYMDDYISYAKEREELEKAYYEKLTNTSFDAVRDEFKSALLDMESDAEEFTSNFEKMLQNAIIESLMTEKYDAALKEWYRAFGNAMEDGDMSQSEKDKLHNDYNNIVSDALKDRDALKDIFEWEGDATQQSGRSGSFEAMSQEQGTKLEGLFTANEMRTARIEETVERVDVQMSLAVGHLAKIEENTGECAEYLEAIKDYIRRMFNDGVKAR